MCVAGGRVMVDMLRNACQFVSHLQFCPSLQSGIYCPSHLEYANVSGLSSAFSLVVDVVN